MKYENMIKKTTAYLALATVGLFILTGYGITQYRIVEAITFGILTKPLSFKLHYYLIYPLVLFLLVHLYFSCNLLGWLKRK